MHKFIFFLTLFTLYLFTLPQLGSLKAQDQYRVGVNYNSTSPDFSKDSFITTYHNPEVRKEVLTQLQNMADNGATFVHTRLWIVDIPEQRFPTHTWRLGFPMSQQELSNIVLYAKDVASIQTKNGKPLDLYLTLLWLGCTNYMKETFCGKTWDQFVATAKVTIDQFINAIASEKRSDGQNLAKIIYFDGEIDVINKKNADKWLFEVYPYFVNKSAAKGLKPSIYFLLDSLHLELYKNNIDRVIGTINFFQDHNLYIPPELDVSLYPQKIDGSYKPVIDKIITDLKNKYPTKKIRVAETGYPSDRDDRINYGRAFIDSYINNGHPEEITFWTTPNAPTHNAYAVYPFDIESFLPTYFSDVLINHPYYQAIEKVRLAGITGGCGTNPNRYCPSDPLLRFQAPIFLFRSKLDSTFVPPPPTSQKFTDVPPSHSAYAWIDKFVQDGITSGCGGGNFCPNDPVTRGQFAVFALRTKFGSNYSPPKATGIFEDVPTTHPFASWIEDLHLKGFTSGCGGGNFCPNDSVTRGETAVLLTRLFEIGLDKAGDFNKDGKVDIEDYNLLIANFGNPYTIFDYNILVENYNK